MPAIRFQTELFKIGTATILRLPDSASARLPSRGQVMVTGTINGHPLQTPLEPDGKGSHWFRLDKQLLRSTGAGAGDTVTLAIESTKDWWEPSVPKDLQTAFAADPKAHSLWMDITPMARWDWLRWIGSTKQSETRKRRIEVAFSKLKAGDRRPCCFNRSLCTDPEVSKNGVLLEPTRTRV